MATSSSSGAACRGPTRWQTRATSPYLRKLSVWAAKMHRRVVHNMRCDRPATVAVLQLAKSSNLCSLQGPKTVADKGEFAKDLRKLSVQQAKDFLLQLGVSPDDYKGVASPPSHTSLATAA